MALRNCFRFRLFCKQNISKLNRPCYLSCSFSVQPQSTNSEHADIVICGGGMVGGAMACALGNNKVMKNKKIILLEAGKEKGAFKLPESYSNRTCALSPSTRKLLESFGAWQEIESMRCNPILRMQVWESCSDSMISFNQENMTESLATMAENDVILAGIMKSLESLGNRIEVRYSTKVDSFKLPGQEVGEEVKLPYVALTLNDGSELKTKLLIGADGFNSAVRQAAGFHTISNDYEQTAVVATLDLGEQGQNCTAWQRFLPSGPIAVLPLSDRLSSLVWTTSPEHAATLKTLPGDAFVDAVNDALWHERDKNPVAEKVLETFRTGLNQILPDSAPCRQLPPTVVDVKEGSVASFPLKLIHSSNYVMSRVALIGDAAHRIHPLAGQGVNLGFGDVECLDRMLTDAVRAGADPGSLNPLLRYETARQQQNVPVMAAIHGLQRLYSTDFTPFVVLRSLGLQATDSLGFLKKKIIEQASG